MRSSRVICSAPIGLPSGGRGFHGTRRTTAHAFTRHPICDEAFDVVPPVRIRALVSGPRALVSSPAGIPRVGPARWIAGATVTALLLLLVVSRIAPQSFVDLPARLALGPLLLGFGFLLLESVFAALRLHVLALPRRDARAAYEVTAWHALWLLALPARLGDVAWVLLMRSRYAWRSGAALGCALFQRLLDLGVVLVFVAVGLPAVPGVPGGPYRLAGVLATGAVVAVAVLALEGWTTWLAGLLRRGVHRPRGWRRRLFRTLMHARVWSRHVRSRGLRLLALTLTAASGGALAAAYLCVLRALGIELGGAQALFLVGATQLVVAIPIQSVGGLGVFEAGLAGLLVLLGHAPGDAAMAALLLRAVSVSVMLTFWLPAAARALWSRRMRQVTAQPFGEGPT